MADSPAILAGELAQPPETGDIELLLAMWRHEEITVVCRRPADMEDHPDLAVRIRGAFGRALATLPPPVSHRHDPFTRPAAFSILFGDFFDAKRRPLPKPFVIDVDCMGATIVVRLRIFGHARFWASQARDALVLALAGGVSIKSESQHRVTFTPEEVLNECADGIEGARPQRDARLLFRSPLAVRSRSALTVDIVSLTNSLVARGAGLAAWQGVRLDIDARQIAACAKAATIETAGLFPVYFQRNSQRQPGRPIPVLGMAGRLGLRGPIEPLAPYLLLGAIVHTGSHAALGLGRYDLATYG